MERFSLPIFCKMTDPTFQLENKKVGFIAYGSGSKSKVFEATVAKKWKNQIQKNPIFQTLDNCQAIDFVTYEKLHKKELNQSVLKPSNEFVLKTIEKENPVLVGARYYEFIK